MTIKRTDEMERVMYAALAEQEPGRHHAALRKGLDAVLAVVERDYDDGLKQIKVTIDMHDSGNGRFIARIVEDCACGKWGITTTLASWSNLGSLSESARVHLASAAHAEL